MRGWPVCFFIVEEPDFLLVGDGQRTLIIAFDHFFSQYRPGQSGNPSGARRKARSITPDLKAALERALSKKIKFRQGEQERIITMATAGIEQLVIQFAKGDRHARRDLIALAGKLGVNLTAGQARAIEQALTADRQGILDAYVARQISRKDLSAPSPVLAPPELLDDSIPR